MVVDLIVIMLRREYNVGVNVNAHNIRVGKKEIAIIKPNPTCVNKIKIAETLLFSLIVNEFS